MLMLPVETPGHTADMLILVLDDTNLARMAEADPAEVKLHECGKRLVNPKIFICHEKESPEFARVLQTRDLAAIVKYLQRGFRFRPEMGDHDRGPEPLSGAN